MSRKCVTSDFNCIFYSGGSKPLDKWARSKIQTGYGKIVTDKDIRGFVFELVSTNVATAFIQIPKEPGMSVKIQWPFITLQLKNLKRYFAFEIQVLDNVGIRRRFMFANYQKKTKISTFCTQMPLFLVPGWNQIHLNLAQYLRRAYGTGYVETIGMKINANVRLRRIYFTPILFPDEMKPACYRIRLFPPAHKQMLKNEVNQQSEHPPSPTSEKSATSGSEGNLSFLSY